MTKTRTGITIHAVEYHRNGIAGEPFYACRFTDPDNDNAEFLATVFPPDETTAEGETDWSSGFHNPRVAVLRIDLLPSVAFGHNSWRGDNYASELYAAIRSTLQYDAMAQDDEAYRLMREDDA